MRTRTGAFAAATVLALVLSGCGGSSGGSTPTPTPTPSTSTPVDGPVAPSGPAARPVKGYTVTPAPQAQGTFQALMTGSQGAFKAMSTYTVTKGASRVGGLVIFDVDPTVVLRPEDAENITTALVKTLSGQSTVTNRMFGGLRVVSATSGETTVAAWFNGDVITAVIGPDADKIKAYVDGSIVV